jgi:Holliday junction resolvasome RuvABC ATP-dependent DNA helicase subunit
MPFDHLVGQEKIKKKLSYYLKVFNAKNTCPFLLFNGQKGIGKTEFARTFTRQLKNKNGSKRNAIELNCGSIKNVENFFTQIFIPIIMDNEVTVFLDEAHELPQDLTNAFLTIFNTEKSNQREFQFRENVFPFDFTKQTFLFATTESDKLFPPFKDRLTTIDFEEYATADLAKIISNFCKGIQFDSGALEKLASTTRGNARSAIKLARDLVDFCDSDNIKTFNTKSYIDFVDVLSINPLGISETEKNILDILKEHGSCSLQELSAKTGLSRTALQRDHEVYLLKKGLMKIDVKRIITPVGKAVLRNSI